MIAHPEIERAEFRIRSPGRDCRSRATKRSHSACERTAITIQRSSSPPRGRHRYTPCGAAGASCERHPGGSCARPLTAISSSAGPARLAERLELRKIDELAVTGALAMPQRDQRRQRAAVAAGHVGVGVAIAGGLAARVGHHARESRQRLQGRPVADVVGSRPGMSQPRHADADDVGFDFRQARVIHPPHPHHARREVVHHQIAYRGQPARELDAARLGHVDRGRALVAMQFALESDPPRTEHAHRAFVAALDLDHLGALVGEDSRRHRSRDDPGEVEDPHARKRHPRGSSEPSSDHSLGGQRGEFLRAKAKLAAAGFRRYARRRAAAGASRATANR